MSMRSGHALTQHRGPAPGAADPPLDHDRLRATLRLVVAAARADALAGLASDDDDRVAALRPLLGPTTTRYTLIAWTRRLRRTFHDPDADPPLGPSLGVPAWVAHALALTVGLDGDGETLAALFQVTPEQVGLALDRARHAVEPTLAHACPERAAAVARVTDPALDVGERAVLLEHAARCPACRAAIAETEALDAALRQHVDAIQEALPPATPRHRRRWRRWLASPALITLALVVGVLALLLALGGVRGWILGTAHDPVPLVVPGAAPAAAAGWLLLGGYDNGVRALDLATGVQRTIVPTDPAAPYTQPILSPNHRLLAVWSQPTSSSSGTLHVYRLDGTLLSTWPNPQPSVSGAPYRYPAGWLDDHTLLVIQEPQALALAQEETQLLALNVDTGTVRVLFQGDVGTAIPSPDGTLVAVLSIYDPIWAGYTLTLRQVDATGLGPPIATFAHSVENDVVWAPDGSRLYVEEIAGVGITSNPTASAASGTPGANASVAVDLVALDRAGQRTTIAGDQHVSGEFDLTGVSPDGQRVIYQVIGRDASGTSRWTTWAIGRGGGRPVRLAVSEGVAASTWLPDGRTLVLMTSQPAFLPLDPADRALGAASWTRVEAVAPDGSSRTLFSTPEVLGGSLLAWFPADAIPPSPHAAVTVDAHYPGTPKPVVGLPSTLHLMSSSAATLDGTDLTVADDAVNGETIWSQRALSMRGVHQVTALSWIPGQPIAIGVMHVPLAGSVAAASRITFLAAEVTQGGISYDYRRFDPAGLGDATDRHYADPLVSPDGATVAFFVVDDRRGTTALWVAGWDQAAHVVDQWPSVSPGLGSLPPLAVWAGPDTLVYARPTVWFGGLPQRIVLERIALDAGRSGRPTPVLTLDAHGAERGIVVEELAMSPGGSQLALRLRHYTGSDPTAGSFDTISLVAASDAAQPVEVARAGFATGLAWSPDGAWLAAAVGGQLQLIAADGRVVETISGSRASVADPVWIGADQLWFVAGPTATGRIMQVTLR